MKEDAPGASGWEGGARACPDHRGGSGLGPEQQLVRESMFTAENEQCWQRLDGDRDINVTPKDVSDILFIRKNLFSIP